MVPGSIPAIAAGPDGSILFITTPGFTTKGQITSNVRKNNIKETTKFAKEPAAKTLSFVINFDIDDVSDDNYELMRFLECNVVVKMWFSANEVLFGGTEGIEATVQAKYQIERGQKSVQKIVGTIKWEAKFSPERTTNPMA